MRASLKPSPWRWRPTCPSCCGGRRARARRRWSASWPSRRAYPARRSSPPSASPPTSPACRSSAGATGSPMWTSPRRRGPVGWRRPGGAWSFSTRFRPLLPQCRPPCSASSWSGQWATSPCRRRSPWWRRPTRPSRRLLVGSCRPRWPTASATSNGPSMAGPWRKGCPEGGRSWPSPIWRRIGNAGPPVARSWVGGFIRVRPALALAVPEDAAGAGRAWPSPRTWDMAARLLAASEAAGSDDLVRSILVRRRRGPGPGDRTALLAGRGRPP